MLYTEEGIPLTLLREDPGPTRGVCFLILFSRGACRRLWMRRQFMVRDIPAALVSFFLRRKLGRGNQARLPRIATVKMRVSTRRYRHTPDCSPSGSTLGKIVRASPCKCRLSGLILILHQACREQRLVHRYMDKAIFWAHFLGFILIFLMGHRRTPAIGRWSAAGVCIEDFQEAAWEYDVPWSGLEERRYLFRLISADAASKWCDEEGEMWVA